MNINSRASLLISVEVLFTDGHAVLNNYDALGSLMSSSLYAFPEGESSPLYQGQSLSQCSDHLVRTKTYVGGHILVNDTCAMTLLPRGTGFIGADREAYYWLKDYQGNNIMLFNSHGNPLDSISYYPYGSPIVHPSFGSDTTPAGARMMATNHLFSGKELIKDGGFNSYDFGARFLGEGLPVWNRLDPLCERTPGISPYAYCANNPVMLTDPTGCEIRGAKKSDAALVVQDIRDMFPGDDFKAFRPLIVQAGNKQSDKSLAKITTEALSSAFCGITLNEDQQALVDIVVNTINSDETHNIRYIKMDDFIPDAWIDKVSPYFGSYGINVDAVLGEYGGIKAKYVNAFFGGGVTDAETSGSLSLIFIGGDHPYGQAVTTGHEIFGHGRSSVFKADQHIETIRTVNLILRVMGLPYIDKGLNHGPKTEVPLPYLLPNFR